MPKVIQDPQPQVNKATATVINIKSRYTPKQAAEIIRCTRQMVMVYIQRGLLSATQEDHQFSPTGKGWVITGKELNRFMKEYTPAPELGGAKRGVKKSLPRAVSERKSHPLTLLQRKLQRAQATVSAFRDELKEKFPRKEEKCRSEYTAVVEALEQYLLVTTPTTPHVQVVTKEV